VDKFPKVEMQIKLQADMMSYTIGSTALAVWVTALMIVAGILLLKGRKSARKWLNCYAISSISVKIINMVVSVLYVLPMTQKMISGMAPGGCGPRGWGDGKRDARVNDRHGCHYAHLSCPYAHPVESFQCQNLVCQPAGMIC
jgi:hypothetical protein